MFSLSTGGTSGRFDEIDDADWRRRDVSVSSLQPLARCLSRLPLQSSYYVRGGGQRRGRSPFYWENITDQEKVDFGAALENQEGKFVKPRPQSCRAALATAQVPENFRVFVPDPTGKDSYPIVTFSWILLHKKYKDPATANALRELFQWSLRNGQRYASEVGYIQLPAAIAEKAHAALKSIKTED